MPSEMKWNDVVRFLVIFCSTIIGAFATLNHASPYIQGFYLSGSAPLDSISLAANMSLLIFLVSFATGFYALAQMAIFFLFGWLKIMFTILLVFIAVMCFGAHDSAETIIIGCLCLVTAALSWIPPFLDYIREHGMQAFAIVWITAVIVLLAFYKYIGIGALAALPLSRFGSYRLQFSIFGAEIYLVLFFWISTYIFKKNFLGRVKDDPILYVPPATYAWLFGYLPLVGIVAYLVFAWALSEFARAIGLSDKYSLVCFLIGHSTLLSGILSRIFADRFLAPSNLKPLRGLK